MTTLDFVWVVERYSARFARVVRSTAAHDRPVPACPGWTVRDLAAHLGEVQRFWAGAVRAGGSRPPAPPGAEPGGRDLSEWYDESRALLVTALRDTDTDAPCWAWWSSGQTVDEVARRQAHEVVVHHWDAQSATVEPDPVDAVLAADGVDEFVERMLPAGDTAWTGPAGTVVLAATDTDRAWTVRLGGPGPEPVSIAPGGAGTVGAGVDASVRASASDLYLLLWRRRGLDAPGVRVAGARESVTALLAWADLD